MGRPESSIQQLTQTLQEACQDDPDLKRLSPGELDDLIDALVKNRFHDTRKAAQQKLLEVITRAAARLREEDKDAP